MKHKIKKLGELASTAICGNDISSSVLYVSALSIFYAGQYAWITLIIVAFVLFLFRSIYGEVVGALPLNGGAYNALLNTTSKFLASVAATLTILSYMATAVISGNEAMHYLHHLIPSLPVIIATIVLLFIFAVLVIQGISESSKVAIGIFVFHLFSLIILTGFILFYFFQHGFSQFLENWHLPTHGSIGMAIFFGFAASMLGVSGFESSANFVEEQKAGVFPKTLRNMWIIVSVINPLMAFFALSLFNLDTLQSEEFQNTLLIEMGEHVGGYWIGIMIAIDAVLVLSGAVLTSFVGVTGLLERMSLDRVMPPYFLKKNKNGSSYRIIILFFILTVSVLLITNGNVKLLAGVYTISFLSVMALFGIGNILLKVKRAKLPRPEIAGWLTVIIAIIAVIVALSGNVLMKPKNNLPSNVAVFVPYFLVTIGFIMIMLNRIYILRAILKFVKYINTSIIHTINNIIKQEFVFFTKGDNIANLNKVMLYIKRNEQTKKIKIVHVVDENSGPISEKLAQDIEFLDREYPNIKIDCVEIKGIFNPALIKELSKKWDIPTNFMFIGSPSDKFPHRIEELGGVRLII